MGNEALETLSKQYVRGEISKPEYRQRRKEIINEATGNVETATQESSATNTTSTSSGMHFKVGVISAIVISALILIYLSK